MEAWEVIVIHQSGLDPNYLHISPLEKVSEQWLRRFIQNAELRNVPQNHIWSISKLSHDRNVFWSILTALMDEGWQPFSWEESTGITGAVNVVLRRVKQ
jgi:hypothetical protein